MTTLPFVEASTCPVTRTLIGAATVPYTLVTGDAGGDVVGDVLDRVGPPVKFPADVDSTVDDPATDDPTVDDPAGADPAADDPTTDDRTPDDPGADEAPPDDARAEDTLAGGELTTLDGAVPASGCAHPARNSTPTTIAARTPVDPM